MTPTPEPIVVVPPVTFAEPDPEISLEITLAPLKFKFPSLEIPLPVSDAISTPLRFNVFPEDTSATDVELVIFVSLIVRVVFALDQSNKL